MGAGAGRLIAAPPRLGLPPARAETAVCAAPPRLHSVPKTFRIRPGARRSEAGRRGRFGPRCRVHSTVCSRRVPGVYPAPRDAPAPRPRVRARCSSRNVHITNNAVAAAASVPGLRLYDLRKKKERSSSPSSCASEESCASEASCASAHRGLVSHRSCASWPCPAARIQGCLRWGRRPVRASWPPDGHQNMEC